MSAPKPRRPAKTVAAYWLLGVGGGFFFFFSLAFAAGIRKLETYRPADAEVIGWVRFEQHPDSGYTRLTDEQMAMMDTSWLRIVYAPGLELKVPGHEPIVFLGEDRIKDGPNSGLKTVRVYYRDKHDGNKPDYFEYSILKCYVMPGSAVLLSGILFISGVWLMASVLRMRKRKRFLHASGKRIAAEFVSAEANDSISDGYGPRFTITARWKNPATGSMQVFRSGDFWPDPTPVLEGKTIDVLMDPDHPEVFCFDYPEVGVVPSKSKTLKPS